jgi:hypothetical protein
MSQAAAQQVQKQYESYIETLKSLQTSIQAEQQKYQVRKFMFSKPCRFRSTMISCVCPFCRVFRESYQRLLARVCSLTVSSLRMRQF